MKKLLLIPIIFLTFIPLSAASAETQGNNPKLLLEALTEDEIKDLNIVVPSDTDPGFHVLTIQVYNEVGVQSERFVYFCKNLAGQVHWDNLCPDLEPIATKAELEKINDFESLPKYYPAQESRKSAGIIAAAIALFLVLSSARSRYIESASATLVSLAADKKMGGAPIKRWGDRSFTWKFPGHRSTDRIFSDFSSWVSQKSLILSRIIADGDYGRAMFGSLWLALIVAAPALGYLAAWDISFNYSTPAMAYLLAIIALGAFDAFAGFIAGWTFIAAILFNNPPTSVEAVLLLVAIALLGYAPVLISAATRTFRRFTTNSDERWAKLVDYLLAPVIGMWAVIKLVEGLNGFIGKQFLISYYAIVIGIFTGIVLLLRMFAEEFANRVYSWRIHRVSTEFRDQEWPWRFLGFIFEVVIGSYFAFRFSEWNYFLAIALTLGYLPKLINLISQDKLPKSKWIYYLTPKGLFLTILLIYSASTFQSQMRSLFDSSQEFLLWWILISAIPAFVFGFFKLFAKSTISSFQTGAVSKYIWRLGSIVIYSALILAIFDISPSQVNNFLLDLNLAQVLESIIKAFDL